MAALSGGVRQPADGSVVNEVGCTLARTGTGGVGQAKGVRAHLRSRGCCRMKTPPALVRREHCPRAIVRRWSVPIGRCIRWFVSCVQPHATKEKQPAMTT
eukprot:561706-Pyramimonas_sp.AAC.1